MIITAWTKCGCGAITVYTEDDKSYSCKAENINKFFPDIDFESIEHQQDSYCCNHCVNHYGLDLCGCGSGEEYGKCDNDFEECEISMQEINRYSSVRGRGSWI